MFSFFYQKANDFIQWIDQKTDVIAETIQKTALQLPVISGDDPRVWDPYSSHWRNIDDMDVEEREYVLSLHTIRDPIEDQIETEMLQNSGFRFASGDGWLKFGLAIVDWIVENPEKALISYLFLFSQIAAATSTMQAKDLAGDHDFNNALINDRDGMFSVQDWLINKNYCKPNALCNFPFTTITSNSTGYADISWAGVVSKKPIILKTYDNESVSLHGNVFWGNKKTSLAKNQNKIIFQLDDESRFLSLKHCQIRLINLGFTQKNKSANTIIEISSNNFYSGSFLQLSNNLSANFINNHGNMTLANSQINIATIVYSSIYPFKSYDQKFYAQEKTYINQLLIDEKNNCNDCKKTSLGLTDTIIDNFVYRGTHNYSPIINGSTKNNHTLSLQTKGQGGFNNFAINYTTVELDIKDYKLKEGFFNSCYVEGIFTNVKFGDMEYLGGMYYLKRIDNKTYFPFYNSYLDLSFRKVKACGGDGITTMTGCFLQEAKLNNNTVVNYNFLAKSYILFIVSAILVGAGSVPALIFLMACLYRRHNQHRHIQNDQVELQNLIPIQNNPVQLQNLVIENNNQPLQNFNEFLKTNSININPENEDKIKNTLEVISNDFYDCIIDNISSEILLEAMLATDGYVYNRDTFSNLYSKIKKEHISPYTKENMLPIGQDKTTIALICALISFINDDPENAIQNLENIAKQESAIEKEIVKKNNEIIFHTDSKEDKTEDLLHEEKKISLKNEEKLICPITKKWMINPKFVEHNGFFKIVSEEALKSDQKENIKSVRDHEATRKLLFFEWAVENTERKELKNNTDELVSLSIQN